MRQRIGNLLRVEVEGGSLEGATDLEFYIKQWGGIFLELTPTVVDDTHIEVEIPYDKAMQLTSTQAKLQLAYTDETGQPCATDTLVVPVEELLKEAGYAH